MVIPLPLVLDPRVVSCLRRLPLQSTNQRNVTWEKNLDPLTNHLALTRVPGIHAYSSIIQEDEPPVFRSPDQFASSENE